MIAILLGFIAAAVVAVASWRIDQRVLRCESSFRAGVATVLAAVSTWVIVVILSTHWLSVPGASGPVQFWYDNAQAEIVFEARLQAFFLLLGSMILAVAVIVSSAISIFASPRKPWRRLLFPAFSLVLFLAACFLFQHFEFAPRV